LFFLQNKRLKKQTKKNNKKTQQIQQGHMADFTKKDHAAAAAAMNGDGATKGVSVHSEESEDGEMNPNVLESLRMPKTDK
jgi:hypothetical protein